jgi:hypothetical protein
MKARAFAPALAGMFVLAASISFADTKAAMPAGMTATTATLDQVIALNPAARGMPEPGAHAEDWTITTGDAITTEHALRRGSDFVVVSKTGPLTYEHGRLKSQFWDQNENGLTVLRTKSADPEAFEPSLADIARDGVALRILGEISAPTAALVLKATPPNDSEYWLFINKATGRLFRRMYLYGEDNYVVTYDDFRTADGETRAWHAHLAYEKGKYGTDETMRSYGSVATSDAAFAIPQNRRIVDHFPAGATKAQLPAQFLDNGFPFSGGGKEVVVRVNLGDRAVDLALDSGASGIYLNRDLVKELGYEMIGDRAIVPKLNVGPIELDNVVVQTHSFQSETGVGVRLMGLLGFDFIADAVVHVDYLNERLDAIDPDAFHPKELADAWELPVDLDDQVPVAPAQVGNAVGHFLIDTGSFASFVTERFAELHPRDVADRGFGTQLAAADPDEYVETVTQKVRLRPVQVDKFVFGGTGFMHPVIFRDESQWLPGSIIDGLVGQDFLHNYDLYFDYLYNRVFVVPNKELRRGATAPK